MPPPEKKTANKPPQKKKLALISASEFSKALEGIKLTIRQRKWLRVYVETGNYTEAARQAYTCKNNDVAWQMGYYNLKKLEIPIKMLMDLVGISDGAIAKALQEGLKAERVVVASHEGIITDERSFPDYAVRKQYAELALKTKGHLKERVEMEHIVHDPGNYKSGEDDPESYIEACLDGVAKKVTNGSPEDAE